MSGSHNETGNLPHGWMLGQRYLIVAKVGQGGMGAAYKAVDTFAMPRKAVAIKEMSQANLSGTQLTDAKNQFQREADLLKSLSHSNLPQFYNTFEENGRSYLVMEFVEGKTLQKLLDEAGGKPLPASDVLNYANQLCDVLAYLHQQHPPVIFRDLKPANVMVTKEKRVVLIDFGIARFFKVGQTKDTRSMGTEGYAPPEQYGKSQTNPRSDLYSLGATLHYCLTGINPHDRDNIFVFPPVYLSNPQVFDEFDQLIQRLVAINEKDRPASALEVRKEMRKITERAAAETVVFGAASPIRGSPAPIALRHGHWDFDIFYALLRRRVASWFSPGWQQQRIHQLQRLPGAIWAGTPPVWTRSFNIIFLLLASLTLLCSLFAFAISHSSLHFVAFVLSFILLFMTTIAGTSVGISERMPRGILLFTGIAALISCLALQTDPAVQEATRVALHGIAPSQFLAFGLVALAIVTLLRSIFKWKDWIRWVDHTTAFGIAITCALLQNSLGAYERIPFLSSDVYPLANTIFSGIALNQLVVIGLLLSAFILLSRVTRDFSKLDRALLFLVTLGFVWLQLSFGEGEVQHLFPNADQQSVLTINQGIAFGLAVVGFAITSPSERVLYQYRQNWIGRALMLGIVLPVAFLQNFLANEVSIPFLSAEQALHPPPEARANISFIQATTFSQLVIWGLGIAALILLARLGSKPNWVDRIVIFIVACATALLQLAFGEGEAQHMPLSPYDVTQSPVSLLQIVSFNRLLVLGLIVTAIVMVMRQAYQYTWLDRLVLIGISFSSGLLQVFFGGGGDSLPAPQAGFYLPSTSLDTAGHVVTGNLVIAGILGLIFLISLLRLKREFNGWDRILLVLCAGSSLLLAWNNTAVQQLPLLSANLQQMADPILSRTTLNGLVTGMLLIAVLISLLWLRRPFPPEDRKVLVWIFGIAGVCASLQCVGLFLGFLQFLGGFLPLALIILILGVIMAVQMERV